MPNGKDMKITKASEIMDEYDDHLEQESNSSGHYNVHAEHKDEIQNETSELMMDEFDEDDDRQEENSPSSGSLSDSANGTLNSTQTHNNAMSKNSRRKSPKSLIKVYQSRQTELMNDEEDDEFIEEDAVFKNTDMDMNEVDNDQDEENVSQNGEAILI